MIRTLVSIFLGLLMFNGWSQESGYSLFWKDHQAHSILIIQPMIEGLQVRLKGSQTPIAGKVSVVETGVRFEPSIPFTNGLDYEVIHESKVIFTFKPDPYLPPPKVVTIYPKSDVLPENFLKFYIEFDQSMGIGKVYDHIHLYSNNQKIHNPFLKLQPELWDVTKRILTIWIDPGRIKTDLGPNVHHGPVLQKGLSYQLRIDTGIVSASGIPIKQGYTKEFIVNQPDKISPNIDNWTITTPSALSFDSLSINLHEKMDYSIINHIQIHKRDTIINGKLLFKSQL